MAGLLEKLRQSFWSKVGEKLAECAWEALTGNKDPKSSLKTLQRSLKSLSDKACDIKDQIKHGEQSGKMKRKREVENWLEEVTEIESELGALLNEVQEEGFLGRFFGEGGPVSELNTRVCELVDQCRDFGELLLVPRENRGELLLTGRLIGEMFEKNIEVIWEWLVIDKVKSIGIYGMGGVGKTTLAKHINNRLQNENRRVYWVTVSHVFTRNKLQSDIAKVVGLDLSDEENEDKRAARLNEALTKKEDFVLILDDVWSDIDLKQMGDPLGVDGCRLIVTTRSLRVCQRIDCEQVIGVKTLQSNESWTLFRETLGVRTTMNSEVEKIAKLVAEKCDGLPLGIIVLANSMKGVTNIREWRNVYDDISESDEMEEKVFPVLRCSFDRLDPKFREKRRRNGYTNLQLCFLYCSLYPEDYKIDEDKLVRKFISEGLVDKKSLEKQMEQGYTMLSKLVDLCLLESFGSRSVKMHDLVRDMALSIARESPKYKVFAGLALKDIPIEEEWTEDVDKISLMDNAIEKIPIGMAPNCPKLATLLLNENPFLWYIPDSFFAKMSGLCVLDLSLTSIRELPNSLSDLESLDTLLLNNCGVLAYVPFLGKLKALRELDLSNTSIKEVPKGMENLINLKILLFKGAKNLKFQPGDLPIKSRNLQHLEFPLETEVPVHEIESFKQLNTFVGRFKDISDFNWFQSQTGGLISKFYCHVGSPIDDWFEVEDKLLGENSLTIYECSLKRGEEEDGVIILPQKIKELQIVKCKGLSSCVLDDFKLCSSSVIEDLRIVDCEGIQSIWNINNQLMGEKRVNVANLYLKDLPDLKCLVNWEEGGLGRLSCPPPQAVMIFSSLETLIIYHCHKMKTLGLPLPCLHNITSITIKNCGEIEVLIELDEDYEEISEPTHSLPRLKELTLWNLPKLKSICKARVDCKSIEKIVIHTCPSVKKLGLCLHNITSIRVHHCREIEELIELDEDYEEISEPTHSLPRLRLLALWILPKLKSICKSRIDCKSIEDIVIDSCPSVKKLGLCLHNITRIDVSKCGEIEELIELDENYEEISESTHSLPNLNLLFLKDLPKLKSICKARIDCKSIEEIVISGCPKVKKLPLFLPSSSDGGVINYSPPPALSRIEIHRELWESLEWDDDIRHKHLLQPFVIFPESESESESESVYQT